MDVSWQPRLVRGALTALRPKARHWTYISSCSVYADHSRPGGTEDDALLDPTELDEATLELYGEAKVACELATREAGDALIVRAGLIGGPGDRSDRAGYWVARAARDPRAPMLVPEDQAAAVQVIDVRDLAAWVLDCGERAVTGTYDAVGPVVTLEEWITTSRLLGGHRGAVVAAAGAWLREQNVEEVMGPQSLPLWVCDPEYRGFMARLGASARIAGLRHRPIVETLTDTLAWERELGVGRERRSGIGAERETELLAKLGAVL